MAKDKPTKIVSKKHLARLERERRQTRLITSIAVGIVVIIVGLIGYGILNETVLKSLRPVVTINGESVTMREYQIRVKIARQQYVNQYMQYYQFAQMLGIDPTTDSNFSQTMGQIESQLSDPSVIGQQVVNEITDDLLIRQYAKANGIVVTEADIEKAIQDAYGYYPEGTPTPSPTLTPLTYPTWSATQFALMTPTSSTPLAPSQTPTETPAPSETPTMYLTPDLSATPTTSPSLTPSLTSTLVPSITSTPTITPIPSLTPTATPYTVEGFQKSYQDGLNYYAKLGITEADFRKIFFESNLYRKRVSEIITANVAHEQEQVWAREILVADEATAKSIREQLVAGADFASLAAADSIDSRTKNNGGDLGWFGKGKESIDIETAAFALKVGEISQPIQTTTGWHVIQVLGHEIRPLTETEYQTAVSDAFNTWLQEQSTAAKIVYSPDLASNTPDQPSIQSAFTELNETATAYFKTQSASQPTLTP